MTCRPARTARAGDFVENATCTESGFQCPEGTKESYCYQSSDADTTDGGDADTAADGDADTADYGCDAVGLRCCKSDGTFEQLADCTPMGLQCPAGTKPEYCGSDAGTDASDGGDTDS